jgi:hypothetical protein
MFLFIRTVFSGYSKPPSWKEPAVHLVPETYVKRCHREDEKSAEPTNVCSKLPTIRKVLVCMFQVAREWQVWVWEDRLCNSSVQTTTTKKYRYSVFTLPGAADVIK